MFALSFGCEADPGVSSCRIGCKGHSQGKSKMGNFFRKMARAQARKTGTENKGETNRDFGAMLRRLESDTVMRAEVIAKARQLGCPPCDIVRFVSWNGDLGREQSMGLIMDDRSNSYGSPVSLTAARQRLKGYGEAFMEAHKDAVRQGGMKWSIVVYRDRADGVEILPYKLPTGQTADASEEMGPDDLSGFD